MTESTIAFDRIYYRQEGNILINLYSFALARRASVESSLLRSDFVLIANNADVPRHFDYRTWGWRVDTFVNDGVPSHTLVVVNIPDHRLTLQTHINIGVQLDQRLVMLGCEMRTVLDGLIDIIKAELPDSKSEAIRLGGHFRDATIDIQRLCDAAMVREAIINSLHPTHGDTLARAKVVTGETHEITALADRLVDETMYQLLNGRITYRTGANPPKNEEIIKWLQGGVFGTDNVELPEIDHLIPIIIASLSGGELTLPPES